jgi:hypothetical protein
MKADEDFFWQNLNQTYCPIKNLELYKKWKAGE